ncbi:hypothetical protein [Mucilaginibacter segetis]|uniref:NACHT domain-containing protein n=1 Tax=Mucilaginibacter segetis TaxID=2793071 RepID=A0A934PVL9_9SPHI|nr:hypothetical protein [Mucilaginibacter segetis]MBK0380472.1 hypothetical protein [Mucilaginibacter segetis]
MTILSPKYFDSLKETVLNISGFKTITPCDCKVISLKIFEKTKNSLSETTLKRVYGFAYTKFNPSVFTIDVMAKYCGYEGWDDFCTSQQSAAVKTPETNTNWDIVKLNATKITNLTLQALKNKTGIPYSLTIKRNFIDTHLDEFSNNNYTATVISAPTGYGKTVAICHWIEERLQNSNDTILFFSGNILINAFFSGSNINDWLLSLLGYSTDKNINALINSKQKAEGNFYFIIDGFDEHYYKNEQFHLLLDHVLDIFSVYQGLPWFKLILTMRSYSWINNKHIFENNRNKWFNGFILNVDTEATNVPLLSIGEIKQLFKNIKPSAENFLTFEIANNFNYPLYFEYYYKEYKDECAPDKIDQFCLYNLIISFITKKIYLGTHSAEKLLLLNTFVEAMSLETNNYTISKLKVLPIIKKHHYAYAELISIGFIREINSSVDLEYKTHITFCNDNFLEFTIAKTMLYHNNDIFDEALINAINVNFENSHRKLSVLKWCIIYASKTSQQNNLDVLTGIILKPNEKSDLILFLGDMFERAYTLAGKASSIVPNYEQNCIDRLFNYFFDLELISPDYKKTLKALLKFELTDNKKIIIYTSLAAIAIQQLKLNKLEEYLFKLKSFPSGVYTQFPINPLNCIDTIYQNFKYGAFKKDFFAELTRFYFNPPLETFQGAGDDSKGFIYLLAAYTLTICKRPAKIPRFIAALHKIDKPHSDKTFAYNLYLQILLADSYFDSNKYDSMEEIYQMVENAYTAEEKSLTPFIRSVFYSLKIKMAIANSNYQCVAFNWNLFNQFCDESGNRLSQMLASLNLLNSKMFKAAHPEMYKKIAYQNAKWLRESGLNQEVLTNPVMLNSYQD